MEVQDKMLIYSKDAGQIINLLETLYDEKCNNLKTRIMSVIANAKKETKDKTMFGFGLLGIAPHEYYKSNYIIFDHIKRSFDVRYQIIHSHNLLWKKMQSKSDTFYLKVKSDDQSLTTLVDELSQLLKIKFSFRIVQDSDY